MTIQCERCLTVTWPKLAGNPLCRMASHVTVVKEFFASDQSFVGRILRVFTRSAALDEILAVAVSRLRKENHTHGLA